MNILQIPFSDKSVTLVYIVSTMNILQIPFSDMSVTLVYSIDYEYFTTSFSSSDKSVTLVHVAIVFTKFIPDY